MKKRFLFIVILLAIFLLPNTALAQDYYFSLEKEIVHVYWNEDGTSSLDYTLYFSNSTSGHAIEYVDVGLPNGNFRTSNIHADVNGQAVTVSTSEYQGGGTGVAVVMGSYSIPPGARGTVHVYVASIEGVLRPDTQGDEYASAVFSPFWFDAKYVAGGTDITVVFHLPPDVQPEEPRWHDAPSGFSETPFTDHDQEGRVTYTWTNPNANAYTQYKFGASFPIQYVPTSAVTKPSVGESLGFSIGDLSGCLCPGIVFAGIILIIILGVKSSRKRKLKYLPPKMKIEGHGIKRGLTAIEAAILLEKTPDKILTMILFACLQKEAAQVISRDPLKLKVTDPSPESLRKYEVQFLEAFKTKSESKRKLALQDLMIDLIKSIGEKMKGFSHRESVKYYESIMKKAWSQVENADTPEVKSEKYNEHMGWTMLDEDFEDRTQNVFRHGPVFVPMWWHRYDPSFGRAASTSATRTSTTRTSTASPSGKQSLTLPNLPGGEFAASVVTGIQGFSNDVVGNITNFTDRITNKTNPVPKTSSSGWKSSSGGGSSCACACACAGCACACAGGGR